SPYFGAAIFSEANIGLFMSHGSYGMQPDYTSGCGGSLQAYIASGNPNDGTGDSSLLRLGQFGFCGDLKWMAILGCNILADPNYQNMVNHGGIPLKETHMLCSASTVAWMTEDLGAVWGKYMISKKRQIADAWFNAGTDEYHRPHTSPITNTVMFRVTG